MLVRSWGGIRTYFATKPRRRANATAWVRAVAPSFLLPRLQGVDLDMLT